MVEKLSSRRRVQYRDSCSRDRQRQLFTKAGSNVLLIFKTSGADTLESATGVDGRHAGSADDERNDAEDILGRYVLMSR